MKKSKEEIISILSGKFNDLIFESSNYTNELAVIIQIDKIKEFLNFIFKNEELSFIYLNDLTAVDWNRRKNRFQVVYHVFSFINDFTLRIKSDIPEGVKPATITDIFKAANWLEREVYDMFGVEFEGHPDLRRMYMQEDFELFPLRKDFPLMGVPNTNPSPRK